MADFTPINANSWRLCQHCNTHFESTVPFTYVHGKDSSGHTCCPSCAKHYEGCKAIEQAQCQQATSIDFTAAQPAVEPSRHELVKAMSAVQHGDNIFPSQRFSHPAYTLAGDHGKMLPPPVPAHVSMGYTPNHAMHHLYRSKMAQAASSGCFHQVMIWVALHHLKPEGKSGTVLVGNIECDVHVALNITLAQLQSKVINQLEPLWTEWSHSHALSLYSLEMHKSPKMILYDPRQLSIGANEPVLQEFFMHAMPKDPTPKFYANAHVTILLVMMNVQFKDVLLWQEQCVNNIVLSINVDVQNALASASSISTKKKVLQSQGSSNDSSPSPPHHPAHKHSRKCSPSAVWFPISEISKVLSHNLSWLQALAYQNNSSYPVNLSYKQP
ncbi:uncharacterized protein BJ212DRAFT_1535061 [Suillus subaureus]|uniref:Uncharacterized protein n=1 Tax=Suillus subaureus TaxID=48587 RepID=A0A9P7E0Y3_9AGAM|nr:uncharacterized protein BJ212DRAFT_1535061 [Suillus subaureus]KAG1807770.1 hypothetical protein BJ212DRAFT_1535061 [Suillus subaureus]